MTMSPGADLRGSQASVLRADHALLVTGLVVLVLPHVPVVGWIVGPFTWLGTLVHESGHGLAAIAVGGGCDGIWIFPGGGGYAMTYRPPNATWQRAVTAGAGLVGPAVVSAALLWAAIAPATSRLALGGLGAALLSLAFTLTEGFATVAAGLWGVVLLAASWRLSPRLSRGVILVVAAELTLKLFRSADYLFTAQAHTRAGTSPSDVANIATGLGGHYLMWGLAVGVLDLGLLALGLYGFFLGDRLMNRLRPGAERGPPSTGE